MGANLTSPWEACQAAHNAARDLSQEREAQDATLASKVAEAVAREMAKAYAHYQAVLNERRAVSLLTSLKVTSGASGFKVIDPFD